MTKTLEVVEEAVDLSALETYLKARDAYVKALSEEERAALRLKKELIVARLLEARNGKR